MSSKVNNIQKIDEIPDRISWTIYGELIYTADMVEQSVIYLNDSPFLGNILQFHCCDE